MSHRLIVAEKPSVGRDIANVLNCRENGPGCRIGDSDVVTWAVGHLVGLCYPGEIDEKYVEWRISDLPILPDPFRLKVLDGSKKQFEIVKKLMNDPETESIVCATDAGREGELIFRYIYEMAGCKKPVQRLWISSMTYRAIKEGFENLKPAAEYDDLYESARCRSEADWLVGMNGSRAFALENEMRHLSVGRVFSPTLAILVKRELEIRNFIPEEYCELIAGFDRYEGKCLNPENASADERFRFPVERREELEHFAKDHFPEAEIVRASYEEEMQPPRQLYDLTSLQRDANRIFRMPSKRTLDVAQSLYERRKAITYPRTDSRFLTSDMKSTLPKRLESFRDGEVGPFAEAALRSDRNLFGRFINNKGVSDHHAIIPTGEAKGMETWTKQEQMIFGLIARRFIAMFLPDRRVIHQKIEAAADGRTFISIGENVLEEGWSAADPAGKAKLPVLPELCEGDRVPILEMRVETGSTKPPAPHTEASLLAAMEHAGIFVAEDSEDDRETEFGIGTPATRAATIEKLIEKEMVVRKGRALIPTEYGIRLVGILPEVLRSPEMTGEWEAKLARISRGAGSPETFMEEIRGLTKEIVDFAVRQGNTGIKNANYVGTCPLCGSRVREYDKAYYCVNRACAFRPIYKAVRGGYPTLYSEAMRELLEKGVAVTEKGTYSLRKEAPFVGFVRNGSSAVVDADGGGQVEPAVGAASAAGQDGGLASGAKPVKGKQPAGEKVSVAPWKNEEQILELIRNSGFEFVDKRSNGGSLWIVAGKDEAENLVEQCKKLGAAFAFTQKGGKASKKRPAWYSTGK